MDKSNFLCINDICFFLDDVRELCDVDEIFEFKYECK